MSVRELTDDVRWVRACHEVNGEHEHVSVYLVDAPEGEVLLDTGSYHDEAAIADAVAAEAGDLAAIVLSHSDLPHAGNVAALRERFGDVELVASSGAPAAQGLSDAVQCPVGGSMGVAGREFAFLDPPLADRSHSTWIVERGTGVLFTADGFGARHPPGHCDWTSAEFEDGVPRQAIREYHENALVWLSYVDPPRLRAALERVFDRADPSWVAPVHGHPIAPGDRERFLDRLETAAAGIAADADV